MPRWVRGHAEVTLAGPTPQPLVAVALGGSVGTSDEGIEAQVVEVASLDALNALPATTVGGKIVFINQRMERTRDGSGYGATVRNRSAGPERRRQSRRRRAGDPFDRHFRSSAIAHTGSHQLSRRCAAHPGVRAVESRRGPAGALAQAGQARTRAREVDGSRAAATWSANVIGEIPGTERANEIVLLGAHLDSWDLGQGAIDDGAGVAIVIEAARLIGRLERKPARTVRVVLFANEEFGLSGAREYARLVGDEAARHVIAVEADLGAGAGVADSVAGRAGCSAGSRRDPRGAEAARARSRQQRRRAAARISARCARWACRSWICRRTRRTTSTSTTR